jgi:hypothetical protein
MTWPRRRTRGGRALRFAASGLRAFAGRGLCAFRAAVSARSMRLSGLRARVASAPGAGHTYGGAVAAEVAGAFAWVVEDDPRFQPSEAAPRP